MDAWDVIGLNTFPMFAQWMKAGDPLWPLADEARRRGFFMVNIDSPLHRMVERRRKEPEIFCQFEDGGRGEVAAVEGGDPTRGLFQLGRSNSVALPAPF